MATVALNRFSDHDTLMRIGDGFVIELLSPYGGFFTGRGLALPATAKAGPIDYEKLASILMTPDTDMPRALAEALFNIHDMSTPEGMDKLQDAAEERGLDLGLNGDTHPAGLAVRLWLGDSTLFEEVHAEYHLTRPKSFLTYLRDEDRVPTFAVPSRETLAAMEARMDVWFEKKRRGRGCRVLVYPLQLFVRVNCKLGLLGQDAVDVPPVAPQFPALAPQGLVITNTSGVVAVKLTCPGNPGENTVLRASPPQNSAIRACRNFRIIGTCPVPTAGSADITSLYVAEFGAVPVGKRLFVQASTMVDGFESLPRQFQARVPAA